MISRVCWVHICDVEVDVSVLQLKEFFAGLDLDGHVVHIVVNLGHKPDGEVGAKFVGSIAVEIDGSVRLIWIESLPNLIVAIFGSHFHAISHPQQVTFIVFVQRTGHEAVDENFLVNRAHVLHSTIPDWRIFALVKGSALHRVIEHVLELLVADRIYLVALAFVIFSFTLSQLLVEVVNRAAVYISLVIDEHV